MSAPNPVAGGESCGIGGGAHTVGSFGGWAVEFAIDGAALEAPADNGGVKEDVGAGAGVPPDEVSPPLDASHPATSSSAATTVIGRTIMRRPISRPGSLVGRRGSR
jgi:hypothetical protein